MELYIRTAVPDDAQAVHDIYGAYVDSEHITFTEINPDVWEYREKIIHTLKKYPFYIAEEKTAKFSDIFTAHPFALMMLTDGMWSRPSSLPSTHRDGRG